VARPSTEAGGSESTARELGSDEAVMVCRPMFSAPLPDEIVPAKRFPPGARLKGGQASIESNRRLLPLLRELAGRGLSLRQIAAQLDRRGVKTRYGPGGWSASSVRRALARAAKASELPSDCPVTPFVSRDAATAPAGEHPITAEDLEPARPGTAAGIGPGDAPPPYPCASALPSWMCGSAQGIRGFAVGDGYKARHSRGPV
jgi:hypothetical protein